MPSVIARLKNLESLVKHLITGEWRLKILISDSMIVEYLTVPSNQPTIRLKRLLKQQMVLKISIVLEKEFFIQLIKTYLSKINKTDYQLKKGVHSNTLYVYHTILERSIKERLKRV